MENLVPTTLIQALQKQKYHRIGGHSAVKRCKWFYEALTGGRSCYKHKFYGINSHQCIQMSPAVFYCTQQCLFCWRAQHSDLQVSWNEMTLPVWDVPEDIIRGIVRAQSRILSGYKGHVRLDPRSSGKPNVQDILLSVWLENLHSTNRWESSFTHFGARDMTTFLVTNGTLPKKLSGLSCEPTQLYVSVCAPNEEVFKRVCRPQVAGAWESLNETLALLQSFRCPTVMRSTLVKTRIWKM